MNPKQEILKLELKTILLRCWYALRILMIGGLRDAWRHFTLFGDIEKTKEYHKNKRL